MIDLKYTKEKYTEKFWLWLAWLMPKRLAFWCFIRVHSLSGSAPGTYKDAYDLCVQKWNLR